MNQPPNTDEEVYFEIKDLQHKIHKINFDNADYLVESTRIGFPKLCPDIPPTESERSDPAWNKMMSQEVTRFIPALTKAFNEEYRTEFGKGSINTLWRKLTEYKLSLKKNTVEDQPSSAPSTDSTCLPSPPNDITTTQ